MGDRVGQQLGNYRLLRLLGQGSFADVYLGEHIHLRTKAAIKVLQVRLVENNIQNFLNEARTIAHLVHPYIIRVLDFGVQDAIPFLVMDYAPKGTFRQRFLQGRPLPPAPLVSYLRQTAAALQYAHDRKLIHRDVKPENMLMGPNDEVLLSDFGFALTVPSSTSHSLPEEAAGTAMYMAPEQLQGKPRAASDQYAMGIIAYEWLCGSRPFEGSFFEIASQHMLTAPPPLHDKVPGIAYEIEQVIMTALEKDPQKRFPSVRDFALALEDACLTARQYDFDLPDSSAKQQGSLSVPNMASSISFKMQPLDIGLTDLQQSSLPGTPAKQDGSPAPLQINTRNDGAASSLRTRILSQQFSPVSGIQELASRQFSQVYQSIPRPAPQPAARENQFSFKSAPLSPAEQSAFSFKAAPLRPPTEQSQRSFPLLPPVEENLFSFNKSASLPLAEQPQFSFKAASFSPVSAVEQMSLSQPGVRPFTAQQAGQFSPVITPAPPVARRGLVPTRTNTLLLIAFVVVVIGSLGLLFIANANHNGNIAAINAGQGKAADTAQNAGRAKTGVNASATAAAPGNATATATTNLNKDPYAPNTGVLAVNDSLTSNQDNGWSEATNQATNMSCQFQQDGYHVLAPMEMANPCFAAGTSFTNFTYEVKMSFVKIGTSYSSGGIVFRGNRTTNVYYRFGIYASGRYTLDKCDGTTGVCTTLSDGKTAPPLPSFVNGLNQPNTLAVVARDNMFNIYLNNTPVVGTITDPTSPSTSGMIGVFTTGGTDAATEAVFTNAKVWQQ